MLAINVRGHMKYLNQFILLPDLDDIMQVCWNDFTQYFLGVGETPHESEYFPICGDIPRICGLSDYSGILNWRTLTRKVPTSTAEYA
jgi:hypothetical protein